MQLGGHTGLQQSLRVIDVLVEEQIKLSDSDVCRRQSGQIRCPGWRGVWWHVVGADFATEVRTPPRNVRFAVLHARMRDGLA